MHISQDFSVLLMMAGRCMCVLIPDQKGRKSRSRLYNWDAGQRSPGYGQTDPPLSDLSCMAPDRHRRLDI